MELRRINLQNAEALREYTTALPEDEKFVQTIKMAKLTEI